MHRRTCMAVAVVVAAGALGSCREAPTTTSLRPSFGVTECPKPEDCVVDGRMTGGGKQITVAGVKVTRGFTIHCDLILSNNLEINWPDGNNWHIDKPLESAVCTDDPTITPNPPDAPFDTFEGEGHGTLNGVDGAFVHFVFKDAGEPGGKGDQASIQVWDENGVLVLDVPLQGLEGGNIQAHFDQPHK
jgi:hypothetical protein